jgi:hypothetical protein
MGAYGSGRRRSHHRKVTVEDCVPLDANEWVRKGLLRAGSILCGCCAWKNYLGRDSVFSTECCANLSDPSDSWVRLRYTAWGTPVEYAVRLTTTIPQYGGWRWWFTCPLIAKGSPCNRRVAKLYLPPGQHYFGCRHCYDLTYRVCQENQKPTCFDAMLAEGIPGATPEFVRDVFKRR